MGRYRDIFEASTFKTPSSKVSSTQIKQAAKDVAAARGGGQRLDTSAIMHERRVKRIKDLVKVVAGGGKHSSGEDGDLIKFDSKFHDDIHQAIHGLDGIKVRKVDGESHVTIDRPKQRPFSFKNKK
jgi:hypothetical protein